MLGKKKCKILKEIRAQIAEANDIAYVVEECEHKGNCRGTCPKCEQEVLYLEQELEKRRQLGKKVALAGVAGTLAVSMTGVLSGCQMQEEAGENDGVLPHYEEEYQTEGPAPYYEEEDTQAETTEEKEESTEATQELDGDVAIVPAQLG